jgi:hypothetical protein
MRKSATASCNIHSVLNTGGRDTKGIMTIFCRMPKLLRTSWGKHRHTDHFAEPGIDGRIQIKLSLKILWTSVVSFVVGKDKDQ